MAACAGLAAMAACAAPASRAPSGFGQACDYGPQVHGTAGVGAGSGGLLTDLDATISMGARTDDACFGASIGPREE